MANPELTNETAEEYAERMRKVALLMALPVGERAPGGVSLAYYDYAKFAAELAPYRPRRYRVENTNSAQSWYVTADLTEEQYLERIYRPWRDAVKRGER